MPATHYNDREIATISSRARSEEAVKIAIEILRLHGLPGLDFQLQGKRVLEVIRTLEEVLFPLTEDDT